MGCQLAFNVVDRTQLPVSIDVEAGQTVIQIYRRFMLIFIVIRLFDRVDFVRFDTSRLKGDFKQWDWEMLIFQLSLMSPYRRHYMNSTAWLLYTSCGTS